MENCKQTRGRVFLCVGVFVLLAGLCLGVEGSIQTTTRVKKVHLVFMNHLDVGYDGIPVIRGFVNNILNLYFQEYFPRAANLSAELRDKRYTETFVYTTHPWLVALYMNCPPNLTLSGIKLKCPNVTQRSKFVKAVQKGDITWHSGPMNMQIENSDKSLFEYGLSLQDTLDAKFGIKRRTKVLSQRDVPGMTQTAIPLLVKHGIAAVSVGVNTMTAPPGVPRVFRWRYGKDEVLATWHAGGYPNNPGPDPAHPGGLSVQDCAVLDSFDEALCFAFRTDNSGPPETVQEILSYYEILRAEFPRATLRASTFDNYFTAIMPFKSELPVISSEIGDTWIQGIASDPRKLAEYRAATRVMSDCVSSGECVYSDMRVWNASLYLLKLGEHTWGLDSVVDHVNWSNPAFYKARQGADFVNHTLAWLEQRAFLNLTQDALQDHPVAAKVKAARSEVILHGNSPDLTGFATTTYPSAQTFDCPGGLTVAFATTGGLTKLQYQGRDWAGPDSPLGEFTYISYNESDFDAFGKLYDYSHYSAGYTKANLTKNAHPESAVWRSKVKMIYRNSSNKCDFYTHQRVESELWTKYGAPTDVWTRYTVTNETESPGIDIDVQMYNKTSTRLPEALMVNFAPLPQEDHLWYLTKLGGIVDPLDVLLNGSQYQHAIDNFVYYINSETCQGMGLTAVDTPLACIATPLTPPTVFPAPLQPIKTTITSVAFNVYNNIWDTNYIFWYPFVAEDLNIRARFSISLFDGKSKIQRETKKAFERYRG